MSICEDIEKEAEKLSEFLNDDNNVEINKLLREVELVARSWSGSYLGYHSRVYYKDFKMPPPGANFNSEWGLNNLMKSFGTGTFGDWIEYSHDFVIDYIQEKAGNPDLTNILQKSEKAKEIIDDVKYDILSILSVYNISNNETFLVDQIEKLESIKVFTQDEFLSSKRPRGEVLTREQNIEYKFLNPPHEFIESALESISGTFIVAKNLHKIILRISKYIKNKQNYMKKQNVGSKIFIGHGHSHDWRDLKDFIGDRLRLPWDEFNRIPVAGITNIDRLAQMLDQSCIAFLIMSAEDEQADGNYRARMNVIHEVGLFQGRLGFKKAIILLEEGCEAFSNVKGLGIIKYPKGNIKAIFEDIRIVLERENIINL